MTLWLCAYLSLMTIARCANHCAGRFRSTVTPSSWRRTALEALDLIASDRPDAVVLDVMMPRLDGLEVCRQLRSTGDDLPILVLTARDSVSERVAGLDAGADDYLPKPFALEELLARMRALLRRTTPDDGTESPAMTFSDLSP